MTKKQNKLRRRILAVLLCAAMICSFIPAAFAGNLDPTSDARQVSYDSAAEGIVLLENEGTLPLDTDETTVSVFGRSQIDFVKGGGGSGDVNTTVLTNFTEGMKEAGINYYEPLYEEYQAWCAANPIVNTGWGSSGTSNPEMPLTDTLVSDAAANSDVAVVIIARNSTEGADHEEKEGDWLLAEKEKQMLSMVNAVFKEVVVILNIGNTIDMNWMADYDNITAVLIAWQPGSYGTLAVGDVLAGKVTPSGHLVDTWAYNYSDYPASEYGSFGIGVRDPIYGEDIYVGYRYFETFAPDRVRYEFGYGLSYTTFEQEIVGYSESDTQITVRVKVTNTGDTYSGKDVVQVYYSAPQGELGKAAYELAAYGKTDELAPGKSQVLSITYDIASMACYDDSGATGNESCYVLEAGDYVISAGSSVKNLEEAGTYKVSELKVTERLTEALSPASSFEILTTGQQKSDGTYETQVTSASKRTVDVSTKYDTNLPYVELTGNNADIKLVDAAKGDAGLNDYIAQFTLKELVQLFGGTSDSSVVPPKANGVAGAYGQTFTDYGVIVGSMADGPAGLRLNIIGDDTGNTAFPVATMLACTWNEELIEKVGKEIGKEAAFNDVDIWLAPALNIHRDPFCGRNFEYYSEDPVISGTMTAATTKGMQSQGVGVTLKHYAANSQETDRSGGNSIVSERALREIYLKGFEIAVKSSNPWYVMTSYNKINGSQAASNYELCTQILRDEWGFTGTVMTDWGGAKDNGNASMIRAQQDLSMPSLAGWGGATANYVNLHSYIQTTGNFITDGDENGNRIDVTSIDLTDPAHLAYNIYRMEYNWWTQTTVYTKVSTVGEWLDNNMEPMKALLDELVAMGYVIKDDEGNADFDAVVLAVDDSYAHYGIYKGDDLFCTLGDWATDTTGLITGYVSGDVTMGEMQRCATNIFTSLMQCLNFRTQNGLGKAEYTHGDNYFTVSKSEIQSHSTYIDGYPDGKFWADNSITRAEVAKMFYNLGIDDSGDVVEFTDVTSEAWYYIPVSALARAGIVEGYGDKTFKPEDPITRAEFVAIMVRYCELEEGTGSTGFSDVKADHWAIGYIKTAADAKYVIGFPDGTFQPDSDLTRAQAVTIINRIFERVGSEDNIPDGLTIFPDVKRDHYAWADIVEAAVAHDYIIENGKEVWLVN